MEISVVIPLYNTEKYIIENLKSLINQTVSIDEILVIDDCSTDKSVEKVEKFAEFNSVVKLVQQTRNKGVSETRNKGIKLCKNDWILFMDADDVADSRLIEHYLECLKNSKEHQVSAMYSAYRQIDTGSCEISDSIVKGKNIRFPGDILVRNPIITPSGMLVNKCVIRKIGGFSTRYVHDINGERVPVNEDADFNYQISKLGNILYIDKPLIFCRRHETNLTESAKKSYDAGQRILNLYDIEEIRYAILSRNYNETHNKQDLARVFFQRGNTDLALEVLDTIQNDENKATTLFLYSIYYIKSNKLELLESCLKELLNIDITHTSAMNNLGVVYAYKNKNQTAKEYFEKALEYAPDYIDAQYNKSIIFGELEGPFKFTLRELRSTLIRYTSI